jgi:hypothetical protein
MTRKSKRELERSVERLGPGGSSVPTADLAQLIAADEVEEVDAEADLIRLDGRLYRDPPVSGLGRRSV